MNQAFVNLLSLVGILVMLYIVASILKIMRGKRPTKGFPYEKQESLFTPAELAFLSVLEQAVGNHYRIVGKVRLADIIRVKRGTSKATWQSAFNQIQSKHLDFVACNPNDLAVQFVVELDDSSHGKAKRQNRDHFVEQALIAADIPLFRFPVRRTYSVKEIQNQIFQHSEASER